ncbi:C6 transcription factor [Penicillium brasilianum]|uniref:C6 transcription factor n=1 Tax=Penicillium brasilianum TaxID=104259 RepID=A0A1S9RD55_PENBI|nr:C6 transcription factor [Penicillium brasilianum]
MAASDASSKERRCAKHSYSCRYQGSAGAFSSSDEHDLPVRTTGTLQVPTLSHGSAFAASEGPITPTDDRLSNSSSLHYASSHTSPLPYSPHSIRYEDGQSSVSRSSGFLDARDLDLLSHYLTHTSKTIPFDALDLYALSIGIPNLAFKNEPVMSSLIALAAACKSHDIVNRSKVHLDNQTLLEVQELLELAERHHRASLQHIQATVSDSNWYDEVLANAALMVLYASASHSIRVYLAATAKQKGQRLPAELLPQHSQWISFTRAAHTASTAILKNVFNASNGTQDDGIETASSIQDFPHIDLSSTNVLLPQNGPSEETERLFLPLVVSTYNRAFGRLSERADSIAAHVGRIASFNSDLRDLDVCLNTLPILRKCASAALSRKEKYESPKDVEHEIPPIDGSSQVSPWVAKYMISVTSMKAPRALRRTVMSFLNKAPSEYLNIIQSVLDLPITEASTTENGIVRDSPKIEIPPLDATQLLAMDIFAHWLVLVMLLDGVWWIGGIGQWELGQVVSLMKTQEFFHQVRDDKETWWPQSMYMVKLELGPSV